MTRHAAIICDHLRADGFAGQQALLLARHLAADGHAVSLLSAGGGATAMPPGVTHHAMGARRLLLPGWRLRFVRWQAALRHKISPHATIALTPLVPADIVVPCEGFAADHARGLRRLPRPLAERISAWRASLSLDMILRLRAEGRALKDPTVRCCIAMSRAVRQGLARHDGSGRIALIDAVPTPLGRVSDEQARGLRDALKRALAIPDGTALVVFPFQSARAGGIEPMLLAFRALIEAGRDAVLLLAGPTRYTHLAWIGQLGLRDRVRFVGWPDQPQQLVAAADLVVSPAGDDPAGWGVHLAVDQGRPVVTTAASGAADRARACGGAVLPLPAHPDALAQAICQMLSGPNPPPAADDPGGPPSLLEAVRSLMRADAGGP